MVGRKLQMLLTLQGEDDTRVCVTVGHLRIPFIRAGGLRLEQGGVIRDLFQNSKGRGSCPVGNVKLLLGFNPQRHEI